MSNTHSTYSDDQPLSKLDHFADKLVGELPACPECRKVMEERDLNKCDFCGFSFDYLHKILPKNALPILTEFTDFSKSLDSSDERNIKSEFRKLKKRYPQVRVKMCLLPLQRETQIRHMGLWMLNYCPLTQAESDNDRLWTVFLLVDTVQRRSSVTLGYKAETFLSDEVALELVKRIDSGIRKGITVEPFLAFTEGLTTSLDHSKSVVKKNFSRYKKNIK